MPRMTGLREDVGLGVRTGEQGPGNTGMRNSGKDWSGPLGGKEERFHQSNN